ncbi:hypothetical protein D3C87_1067660 [compost metagenome]
MPMIEHGAGLERVVLGDSKGLEGGCRTVDTHRDVAQVHRLAGVDRKHQARLFAALHFTVDVRLVITQGLGGLARLFFGATAEAQQRFFIAIAEAADIAFDIGFQLVIGRFDPYIQFTLCQRCAAGHQHQHTAGNSSWKLHRRGCYHELESVIEPDMPGKFVT